MNIVDRNMVLKCQKVGQRAFRMETDDQSVCRVSDICAPSDPQGSAATNKEREREKAHQRSAGLDQNSVFWT